MAKSHKYAGAHIKVTSSSLKAEKLLSLAEEVAGTFKQIEVRGKSEHGLSMMVKSIARVDLLEFALTAEDKGEGSTAVTEIGEYMTSQSTLFIFIPFGPKEMNGYTIYKKFMELYGKTVKALDQQARATITELTGAHG